MSSTADHRPNSTTAATPADCRQGTRATPGAEVDTAPGAGSRNVGVGLSERDQPSAFEAAAAREFLAEHERMKAARRAAWQARYQAQEDARRRLAERYGSDLEKRWIADPKRAQVDAVSLLYAFLHKAGPASLRTPEIQKAPKLTRDDALAAVHMIRVARDEARQREIAVMRYVLAHGVTWDALAHALDTTAAELTEWLRRHGQLPDTWTVPADDGTACDAPEAHRTQSS